MIEIQCPNCERVLKVPDKYVGTEGACNYCGGRVWVQSRAQSTPPPCAAEVAPQDFALQSQLAEARAEIVRVSEALDAERAVRERAETDRDAASARVGDLEASVAQAEERERSLTPRAELEAARKDLAESREFAEWLGHELETQRGRSDQAESRLTDVRARLQAIANELACLPEAAENEGEPGAAAEPAAVMPEADAVMLMTAGGGSKSRWAWLLGITIVLLAAAAALGVWGLVR